MSYWDFGAIAGVDLIAGDTRSDGWFADGTTLGSGSTIDENGRTAGVPYSPTFSSMDPNLQISTPHDLTAMKFETSGSIVTGSFTEFYLKDASNVDMEIVLDDGTDLYGVIIGSSSFGEEGWILRPTALTWARQDTNNLANRALWLPSEMPDMHDHFRMVVDAHSTWHIDAAVILFPYRYHANLMCVL